MTLRFHTADEARALLDGATAGPWVDGHEFGFVFVRGESRAHVVARLDGEDIRETGGADLRLLASAPALARSIIALHERHEETLDAIVEAGRERARIEHERDALRVIIEGRTTPPTDAEIAEHWRAGGTWIVEGVVVLRGVEETRRHAEQLAWAAVPWLPIGRDRRPCAWPVVDSEVSR